MPNRDPYHGNTGLKEKISLSEFTLDQLQRIAIGLARLVVQRETALQAQDRETADRLAAEIRRFHTDNSRAIPLLQDLADAGII